MHASHLAPRALARVHHVALHDRIAIANQPVRREGSINRVECFRRGQNHHRIETPFNGERVNQMWKSIHMIDVIVSNHHRREALGRHVEARKLGDNSARAVDQDTSATAAEKKTRRVTDRPGPTVARAEDLDEELAVSRDRASR